MQRELLARLEDSEDALDARIRLRAHGTKVLAIYAAEGLGTVVVPSDIAHAFGKYGVFHVERLSEEYEWITVVDDEMDRMTHGVFATYRIQNHAARDEVSRTVDALKWAVNESFKDDVFIDLATRADVA
jgi:hypothetical protein